MKSQVLSCVALCGAMYSLPHSLNASSLITESAVSSEKNLKPNIILITTDQQSYNTISALAKFNRESGFFSTPNIDRIVKSGTAFNLTYCSNPVSVPSKIFSLHRIIWGTIQYSREFVSWRKSRRSSSGIGGKRDGACICCGWL